MRDFDAVVAPLREAELREWLHRCDGALSTALEGGIKDVSTRSATRRFADELREFLARPLPTEEETRP